MKTQKFNGDGDHEILYWDWDFWFLSSTFEEKLLLLKSVSRTQKVLVFTPIFIRREIVKRLYFFCCCLKFVYANIICPRDAARTHKNWKLLNVKDSVCIFFTDIFCENEKCPLLPNFRNSLNFSNNLLIVSYIFLGGYIYFVNEKVNIMLVPVLSKLSHILVQNSP